MKILPTINNPSDIKNLSLNELKILAQEIREKIIDTVSKNGGHLAPSLGTVELAIAIHYVYNSPKDKIVWDVGHQAYAHKLLTGRFNIFHTLRKYKGISGFLKRKESEHDIFDAGHSSTSVSAGAGLITARDLKKETNKVISIIGDGSLTAGMVFEAMNHIGHLKKNLIIILNDNEMSIAPNVGALSRYLLKMKNEPLYQKLKDDIENIVKFLPPIGKNLVKKLNRVKDNLKHIIIPGALFEELGFKYYGPINGNNLREIILALKWIKKIKEPILLHIITKKGKGYEIAEKNPEIFHGIGPFDPSTGEIKKSKVTSFTNVFGNTLVRLANKDQKIVTITAAMPVGTGLSEFREKFKERYFDVGICEQHAVTFAGGLAIEGFKPVVTIYSTFLQRAFDQVLHDIAMQKLPVIFALDRGGIVGQDGETHHGVFDLSYLRCIPNMIISAPRNGEMLKNLLYTAVNYKDGPFAIRYPRGPIPEENEIDYNNFSNVQIGKCEILKKSEDDIVIIAAGKMANIALKVCEILETHKIYPTVIDPVFIKPLDEKNITANIKNSKLVVTIEDNTIIGGLGSAILELMSKYQINKNTLLLGIPDRFVTHGEIDELFEELGLTPKEIANSIRQKLLTCMKN